MIWLITAFYIGLIVFFAWAIKHSEPDPTEAHDDDHLE